MSSMFLSGDHFLTGLMALGMAWAFLHADSESSTTKALAFALAMTGASIFARIWTLELIAAGPLPDWTGLLVVPGALGFIAAFEWTSRVRATIPAGTLQTWVGDSFVRIAQALIVFYAIAAIVYPQVWAGEFLPGLQGRNFHAFLAARSWNGRRSANGCSRYLWVRPWRSGQTRWCSV